MEIANNARVMDKIILVDTQDNSGCGASSDTTGLLKAMLDQSLSQSILGLLCDPESALLAHQAGIGKKVSLSLGAKVFTMAVTLLRVNLPCFNYPMESSQQRGHFTTI